MKLHGKPSVRETLNDVSRKIAWFESRNLHDNMLAPPPPTILLQTHSLDDEESPGMKKGKHYDNFTMATIICRSLQISDVTPSLSDITSL